MPLVLNTTSCSYKIHTQTRPTQSSVRQLRRLAIRLEPDLPRTIPRRRGLPRRHLSHIKLNGSLVEDIRARSERHTASSANLLDLRRALARGRVTSDLLGRNVAEASIGILVDGCANGSP
jgi:hypothetical protein